MTSSCSDATSGTTTRRPSSEPPSKLFFRIVEAYRDPHHIADPDAPPLARQAIAAARAAHALQDARAHQLLHHLFQIALRHALAGGDLLGLHRFGPRVVGDVDHRLERQQCLARKSNHPRRSPCSTVRPVEPKPAVPRAVELRAVVSLHSTRACAATTSCAIFMPRVIVKGVAP